MGKISTGWYGTPGTMPTKVHVVEDGTPICGAKVGSEMKFQWCARGVYLSYVECLHCKTQVQKRGLT